MLTKQLFITVVILIAVLLIVFGLVMVIGGIEQERFIAFCGFVSMVIGFKILGKLK